MRTLIELIIGFLIFAFGVQVGRWDGRLRSHEPPDLSNGQDDPGYRIGDTEESR